jgi:hypothetical protein
MSNKVTLLKKDALVSIKIGTGFLKKLQDALMDVSANHSEEKLKELENLIKEKKELTEPWMDTIYTLSLLIRSIEEEALNQGLTYEEDVDNITPQES